MISLKWMKNYLGNPFYPYTHADAVLVGNDKENQRNLTDELNQINHQIIDKGHLSDTHAHQNLFDAKLNIEEANILIKDLSNDPSTGIITVTRRDNTTFAINIPKTLVFQSALFDEEANAIVITWSDNSQSRIPVEGLVDIYTGSAGDVIQISVGEDNTISAIVKEGSIGQNLLSSDIQVNLNKAHVHNNLETLAQISDSMISNLSEHISDTQKHIPDGGNVGQVVGMTDNGIGWIKQSENSNNSSITKVSELENDLNYISESDLETVLSLKIDKIEGMGLSENNFTNDEKEKLNGIDLNANNYTHPDTHPATIIIEDDSHNFVTSEEKSLINNGITSVTFDESTAILTFNTLQGNKHIDLSSLQKTTITGKGDEITPGFNENMVWHQNTFQGMSFNYSNCKYMKDKFFIFTKTNYWLMGETPENLVLKDIKEVDATLPDTVVVSNIFLIEDRFYICSYNSDTDYTFNLYITNDFSNYETYSSSHLLHGIEGIEKVNGKYVFVGKLTTSNNNLFVFYINSLEELDNDINNNSKVTDSYLSSNPEYYNIFTTNGKIKIFSNYYYFYINDKGELQRHDSSCDSNIHIFIMDNRLISIGYTNSYSTSSWKTTRKILEFLDINFKQLYYKSIISDNGYPYFNFIDGLAYANATYIGGKYLFIKNNKGIFVNSLEELLSMENEENMFSICSQNIESLCHNYEYILLGTQDRYLFSKIS